ncbi:DNA recombination protein RmuC [Candidatus Poribacteria bacterium]|nr:DNA recombination protein RmuC [Candidatus Poribacteria bacterium]
MRNGLTDSLGDRFHQFQQVQTEMLASSRRSQDERLDKVEESLKAFTTQFDAMRGALVDSQNARFERFQQNQAETLASARRSQDERLDKVEESLKSFTARFHQSTGELETRLLEIAKAQSDRESAASTQLRESLSKRVEELRATQTDLFTSLQDRTRASLDEMRKDNEQKLEHIRATVEEKLQSTLEARLGESFRNVSERLELVHKGLGEMQALATGVGDLKRVLTNVRSRGAFGEVQLEALLEQVLTPAQYRKNAAPNPASGERVEFAVVLPGRDDSAAPVLLPIDAKFPQEDYLRLQAAFEAGDAQAVEAARKGLRVRLLDEAKKIQSKYVCPPHTTDFALLFVPTEGLFAEALRLDAAAEEMQRLYHVILVGPTTLYALLNSLQMGFRTLAIEKRSSEVWKILGAVKTEFGKFGDSLDAVGKKLQEASNKIDLSAQRSRALERRLRDVEALPEPEAPALLPDLPDSDPADG